MSNPPAAPDAPTSPAWIAPLLLLVIVLTLLGTRALAPFSAPVHHVAPPARIATARPAPTPPPAVEPVELLQIDPDDARAINAAIPFAPGPYPPAPPFRFAGSDADRERALTCLATAAWYEAGDDPVGERAVAQVVLNRVRHPAYPGTVCGVVFQGAERRTGCQFSFTCDGSIARRQPPEAAWARSRAVAAAALDGHVEAAVGAATHYHTDWVVPYWSAAMEKIAEVHTHLFFRWPGWWGTPRALSGRYAGGETMDPRLAALAGAAADDPTDPDAAAAPGAPAVARAALQVDGVPTAALRGNVVRLAADDGEAFALELDGHAYPGDYAMAALALCKTRPACTVAGWIRPELVPMRLPLTPAALHGASFLYRKDVALGRETALWNCGQLKRDQPEQCLPGTAPEPVAAQPAAPAAAGG